MKRKISEQDFDLQANAAKIRDLIWLVFGAWSMINQCPFPM